MPEVSFCPSKQAEAAIWLLYREFLNSAEKKRRWNLQRDVPWDQVAPKIAPELAEVVETLCAIKLYLPDYVAKILPVMRVSRGCAWFYANWSYEESKHALALTDWLLRSGSRTVAQVIDLEDRVYRHEWQLPHQDFLSMLLHALAWEWLNSNCYRKLGERVQEHGGEPALDKILALIGLDEQSHYHFFLRAARCHLEHNREAVLERMNIVVNDFTMPALHYLPDSQRRIALLESLEILDEKDQTQNLYERLFEDLSVDRSKTTATEIQESLADAPDRSRSALVIPRS